MSLICEFLSSPFYYLPNFPCNDSHTYLWSLSYSANESQAASQDSSASKSGQGESFLKRAFHRFTHPSSETSAPASDHKGDKCGAANDPQGKVSDESKERKTGTY